MRVVHFTLGSVDPNSLNGINRVIAGLASSMNAAGSSDVSVVTVRRKMKRPGREVFQRDGFTVTACHSMAEALKLFSEIRDEIDLVHMHNAWSIPNVRLGAWLTAQQIPYTLTPHAAFLPDRMKSKPRIKALFHRVVQRQMLDRAGALIAVSRDEMPSIAEFTSNDRIFCVPNGSANVDWRKYRRAKPPGAKIAIGYIGRIGREKNILGLVRSVALLPTDLRDLVEVRVYGDTDSAYAQHCIGQAHSLGVGETVQFPGVVSAAEKWAVLGALDAYIQPSFSEAASIAVVEAISMGLPIVVTRTSGVSYWHGKSFLTMVEPVASELSRGIEEIARKKDLLPNLGYCAREFFEENLLWPTASKVQFEIYQDCIALGNAR